MKLGMITVAILAVGLLALAGPAQAGLFVPGAETNPIGGNGNGTVSGSSTNPTATSFTVTATIEPCIANGTAYSSSPAKRKYDRISDG